MENRKLKLLNRNKTKVLVCTRNESEDPLPKITVNGEPLECVTEYVYLDSLITQDNDCSPEIRIKKTSKPRKPNNGDVKDDMAKQRH